MTTQQALPIGAQAPDFSLPSTVIDRKGVVDWSYVSPVGVDPGVDGVLRALDSLSQRPKVMT